MKDEHQSKIDGLSKYVSTRGTNLKKLEVLKDATTEQLPDQIQALRVMVKNKKKLLETGLYVPSNVNKFLVEFHTNNKRMKDYDLAEEDVITLTEYNVWKENFDFLLNEIFVEIS